MKTQWTQEKRKSWRLMLKTSPCTMSVARVVQPGPHPKRLMHILVVDSAIHLWERGYLGMIWLLCVNYNTPLIIPMQHLGITRFMINIPRLAVDVIVFGECNGKLAMVRPEHNSIALMLDLITKFCNPVRVCGPYSGAPSPTEACAWADEHYPFIACENDNVCVWA